MNNELTMKLEEFNIRSLNQKSEIVWEWGYCLGKRNTEHSRVVLFSLDNYFVELFVSNYDNQVKDIKAFYNVDLHPDYHLRKDNPFLRLVSSQALAFHPKL